MKDAGESSLTWRFRFVVEAADGRPVLRSEAEEILEEITGRLDQRGLQLAGGVRPLDDDGNVLL